MKSSPDIELIEAASAGDMAAIEQLLIQYHPTITRFAQKFCANPGGCRRCRTGNAVDRSTEDRHAPGG